MGEHWILSITEANLALALAETTIGFSERKRRACEKIGAGAYVTFYVSKKGGAGPEGESPIRCIRAVARVVGPSFESNDLLWSPRKGDIFPWRRRIEVIDAGAGVPVRALFGIVSFITDEVNWSCPIKAPTAWPGRWPTR